ncbi:MAG: hypothetical protein JWP27_3039 [Flaviaesturariibacter sp.]|nr:hypothetical protein [Flaviaesturariibacter sp.]
MADTNNLPEGTDTIIDGAGVGSSGGAGQGGLASSTSTSGNTDSMITTGSTSSGGGDSSSGKSGGVRGMVGSATTKIKDEAGTRARGFVSQGLERGSATLTNISTLVGDTVEQIEEKLGPQYGDYARTASQTLTRYADTLANKDPVELVDDARELIRKSPGVALGAAAIVGFGLIRLIKAGVDGDSTGTASGGTASSGSRSSGARNTPDV